MSTTFKQVILKNGDHALCHFKRDIPCFQFSGYTRADKADKAELKRLLKAIVTLADWADGVTQGLSDHYPAQHNLRPLKGLSQGGKIRLPIDPKDPSVFISIWPDGIIEVPMVWYTAGQTQTKWGRLESAVREAVRLAG